MLIRNILIVLFAAWVSFVPEPVQNCHWIGVRIFFAVVLAGLAGIKKPFGAKIFDRSDWPLWLFLLCIPFGALNAVDTGLAARTYFSLATAFLLVFYIGKALARVESYFTVFATAIVSCSIVVSAFGILEVIFRYNPLYAPLIPNPYYLRNITDVIARPMSTLYNPVPLATYLACMLAVSIFLIREGNKIGRYIGFCAVLLNGACLVLTFSRASLAGVVLMFLCYLLLTKRYRTAFTLCAIALAVLAVLSFAPYPFSRFSLKGIGVYAGGLSDGGRIIRMQMSWEMLEKHPFFGVGMNNFRELFSQFYPYKAQIPFLLNEVKVPESMYLALLAETGLAGAVSFLVLLVSLFSRSVRALAQAPRSARQITLLCLCLFPGILASMAGYELLYWFTPAALFSLLCGLLAGAESS